MNKDSITQKLRKKAKELELNYNTVLSKFFFDEFLKLLANSNHKENFMLKGGMLLTYALGIQNRSTQDIDFLVKGIKLNAAEIKKVLEDILGKTNQSDIWFELISDVQEIRVEDKYGGLKFHVIGHLSNIRIPFSIDVATGDPIFPYPKIENYTTILGDNIELKIYPLESVLSEKLQTVLARAENNSRSKDFYDIYAILNNKLEMVDTEQLKIAVLMTFKYRKTEITKDEAKQIIDNINNDSLVKERWIRYQKKNPYAKDIEFNEIVKCLNDLVELSM
ncbi:nucleotidyl transferase AbiEii/AbiGii toxin family protein [Granulicatella sp. zg-ZJ]|uniref:nucleotidyl transferase AbiEii/AbiGii toxin family protein n=1 Tax=Granulicatella sp. zg-ZJ TaxID=2678504 RepID=UPI0013CFC649|nr:nucleotidyl transferase AbiEii/AbiGii toxin family protein [Granulicatella sp. zg-ZJ]NEW62286.1 nucleotidyl transferase AbiEii/AbiGii toxin family protein [Granulicatella sp. zg-ZJ]